MKLFFKNKSVKVVLFACLAIHSALALAQDPKADKPMTKEEIKKLLDSYESSKDSFDGDHFKLRTNVTGFKVFNDSSATAKCAPVSSKFVIDDDKSGILYLHFLEIPKKIVGGADDSAEQQGLTACPELERVNLFSSYHIEKGALSHYGAKRTGVSFGALVVPFKYHLGVKEFSSAPTVAPYIGYNMGLLQSSGITLTPIFSAGLALVPVVDPVTKSNRTAPAFSYAAGVILKSDKNENFHVGLLVGNDFLGSSERNTDPKVQKPWVSFYVGYQMK